MSIKVSNWKEKKNADKVVQIKIKNTHLKWSPRSVLTVINDWMVSRNCWKEIIGHEMANYALRIFISQYYLFLPGWNKRKRRLTREGAQKTAGRKLLAGIIEYYAIKICISASASLRGTFNQKIHQEIASGQFLFSLVASQHPPLSLSLSLSLCNLLFFTLVKFGSKNIWTRDKYFE